MKRKKIENSILEKTDVILLVVDIQDRLSKAIFNEAQMKLNSKRLVQLANIFNIPIVITEQNPTRLGETSPEILQEAQKNSSLTVVAKNAFDAFLESEKLANTLEKLNRSQVIVVGMETHICVFQTSRALSLAGFSVTVANDATGSRTVENHKTGLHLIHDCNCVIGSCESILFDVLKTADDPNFKEVQSLIK